MHEKINITTEYITLGQLLKLANIFESGGMIKQFLQEQGVFVNGEVEKRRGRKLYPGDIIEFEDGLTIQVIKE
ncbi:S4 domain protein YaaA [Cerasibacillus quisquiliarum]|uniref:Uncharacterized protein n=1 Tax=Cerasibacillus quisquiliarum TaxID=227865 RepID=A0A511UX67_9BACI|nr:S4 domain-containing protein YaaA [Cerasibacillus quisquiliarum]MBB5146536.1 S4 domain protein YaaA [Cerasibacillus quisquiliarum]GEN31235.1 hypothetical protein CQU01_14730 [Cerasibacillus quisquiliarum]